MLRGQMENGGQWWRNSHTGDRIDAEIVNAWNTYNINNFVDQYLKKLGEKLHVFSIWVLIP